MEWLGADRRKMRNHRDKVAEIRSIQKLMLLLLLLLLLLMLPLLPLKMPAIRNVLGVFANFGLFIVVFGYSNSSSNLMKNNNSNCYLLSISRVQCGCRISYGSLGPYVSEFP